jgi:hypothetical protein
MVRGATGPSSAGLQAGSPGGVHAGSMCVRGPEAPATAGLEASATTFDESVARQDRAIFF